MTLIMIDAKSESFDPCCFNQAEFYVFIYYAFILIFIAVWIIVLSCVLKNLKIMLNKKLLINYHIKTQKNFWKTSSVSVYNKLSQHIHFKYKKQCHANMNCLIKLFAIVLCWP